jgi:AcrR family transcriptional regulator
MNLHALKPRQDPDTVRERIVTVAEEHFRRIGYAKTAVADIAAALGMSPANVYRYFPSKFAIVEAICNRLTGVIDSRVAEVAALPIPAAERLTQMIYMIHDFNKTMLTEDKRIFDMVEVAMTENWAAISAHCDHIRGVFAAVVRDGIARGEFGQVDPMAAGAFVFNACAGMFHPTLIAQFCNEDFSQKGQMMIDFILRSLRP